MAIIVNIDLMLAKRKMKSQDLAEAAGITLQNLSILKTGKAKAIRFSTLENICQCLNCQPGDILEFKSSMPQGNIIEAMNGIYTEEYCSQLELAYGEHMMSEGGPEAMDKMFENIDINNKIALDFGSGIGGNAFHLASNYNTRVIGVEINPEMIEAALKKRPEKLKDFVDFQLIKGDQILPFTDEHFDITYSNGVIVHLAEQQREATFKEFYRVLKKGGKLVIHDWLSPVEGKWSKKMMKLIEEESLPLYAHSPETYREDLYKYGFKNIIYLDCSQEYAKHNQKVIDRLSSQNVKNSFISRYGQTTYQEHLKGYENIRDAHEHGEVIGAHFIAVKL